MHVASASASIVLSVVQVPRVGRVFRIPLWCFHACFWRTVTMAGMMAYTLTGDREEELPVTGAWTMIKKRELALQRVCCVMYVMYVPLFCLPTRLWSCFRLFCAFAA